MNTEPKYEFKITEHDHVYKGGITKKVKRFVATIVGSYNGIRIGEKTEIYNRPFTESIEKERLYKRYYEKVEEHKLYSQPELN